MDRAHVNRVILQFGVFEESHRQTLRFYFRGTIITKLLVAGFSGFLPGHWKITELFRWLATNRTARMSLPSGTNKP